MPWETTQGNRSLFDSQFAQRPGSRLVRKRMGVVVLAEVAQEDVLQPWMPEPLYGTGALVITEMSAALDDPHLEFVCIWATHKHVHVIV